MSSPNTLPQITKSQDQYSLSVYNDSFDPKNAAVEIVRLKMAFPSLPVGFYDILLDRIKENGFTDKRLKDAINHLIDNCVYPNPTIANIISYDKRVKLYNYYDMLNLVDSFGSDVWNTYKPVKKIGNRRFYASIQDIETYNLIIL